jgi:hypothetical protein
MKREEHAGKTEKRSDTDEDGLVSSVLSDFSESDGSRHEQQRQPSLCPAHTSYPYVLSKDCPVLLP